MGWLARSRIHFEARDGYGAHLRCRSHNSWFSRTPNLGDDSVSWHVGWFVDIFREIIVRVAAWTGDFHESRRVPLGVGRRELADRCNLEAAPTRERLKTGVSVLVTAFKEVGDETICCFKSSFLVSDAFGRQYLKRP